MVATDAVKAFCAMVLAGPFMCGFTQTINDWFDRELDAINEPYRPIPSGAISELEVYSQIAFLLVGSIVVALQLDGWAGNDWPVITAIAAFGSFVAYIYSAPPLKLKANGWTGTYALGSSYIALPWWCGHAMFNAGSISRPRSCSRSSTRRDQIAIVNDFVDRRRPRLDELLPARSASTPQSGSASRRSTSPSSASPRTSGRSARRGTPPSSPASCCRRCSRRSRSSRTR